ncbi:ArsR/SmtB family transcription factor [Hamadaea tsunoensis]|uniref:ArsR/SmtB family transcription factor n=1 Tax=Hamadaea tsunoensis TaxID=53368 RepID=UPI0003FFD111|nr:metalloregulator ArsR/SmtB family transcription factor [Hamadaea tsunoensis]
MSEPAEDELWAAVAEPSRRRVLDLLLARGEATPTTLAAQLPFTRQAVAKHLAVLDRAGLVEARRSGREVLYAVRPDRLDEAARAMAAAARQMAEAAARWDRRLVAIKRLAEAARKDEAAREDQAANRDGAARPGEADREDG